MSIAYGSTLEDAGRLAGRIRHGCEPLPPLTDQQAFGAMFDRFADAKVVLLGEASHGSSEFYRARAAIARRLIERHGFSIVAVEADWPDADRIDRYVRWKRGGAYDEKAFARFPTWMWRNREVADFVAWLREHNADQPAAQRAQFRGLDVYSLSASIGTVLDYLDRVDPDQAKEARKRYGCLTPWQAEPSGYGLAVLRGRVDCEKAVLGQLDELLAHRLDYAARDGEEFFNAAQNARIVRAAERYYRTMYHGGNDSWNLRDRHMFETLQALLDAKGPDARAVVWAHNSHIGDASATAMGWDGQFNIGELCRKAYGEDAVRIGFGTHTGEVAAADDWGQPMEIKSINPSRGDSYEQVFFATGLPCTLTDWRGGHHSDISEALTPARLERAIGVIYRPDAEFHSHYFEAVLPDQFDAWVWFERTHPVTPLPSAPPHGVPETYPFGV